MNDPAPENISGEIVERRVTTHEIQHRIPWGHVALGVGLTALAYVLYRAFVADGSGTVETDETDESMVDVPIGDVEEGYNQVAGLVRGD